MCIYKKLIEQDFILLFHLYEKILDIFKKSCNNERMITSILAFLDRLLSLSCIRFR